MNLTELSVLLERVCLNGTINECVLTFKDGVCSCKAMDLTSTIFVATSAKVALDDTTLAFGNMATFIKYIKSITGIDADVTQVDNRLTIKPKGGGTLKFLLAEPDFIPTYDAEWESFDRVAAIMGDYNSEMVLTNESISEFSSLMRLFSTKSVTIHVSKKGLVTITGGNENEHQFTVTLGKSAFEQCDIELTSGILLAVLSVLDYTENPVIMLAKDKPIIISCNESTWVINPLSDVSHG